MSSARVLCALAAVSLSIGCKKGPPELSALLATHQAAVTKTLEAIEKSIKTPLPAPNGTLKVDGPVKLVNLYGPETKPMSGNAALLHAETLPDLTRETYSIVKFTDASLLNRCAGIIRKKAMPNGQAATGYLAERPITLCGGLRYVFVIEEKQVTKPMVNEAAKTFTPGTYTAVLHGYDLSNGAYLGGVKVEATTHDDVKNFRGKGYASDAVDGKFESAAYWGIKNALLKAIPSIDFND